MGRGAQVRRLSGAAAGARGRIPMLSEAAQTPETGHEKRADMPNQHLGWNSVTRRPLAPPLDSSAPVKARRSRCTALGFGFKTHLDMRADRYTAWDRPFIALPARATRAKVPF